MEVIDGDTLRIKGSKQSIRLFGVDACEKDQTATNRSGQAISCGDPAVTALQQWTAGKTIRCEIRDYDRYNRALAVCGTEQVSDFSAELIRQGLAVAYRYRKQAVWPEYGRIEERAKRQKTGIWAYTFDEPWIHRKKQRD
ncbi:thermonuclease family protein [Agrobacterium larrymoorei]|uniref:Thermonuclease family protein n=1 Tax=Agrobacterium larrymoorei TaxID=160699 RepID=A0ABX8TE81_9HYPH|nr:thermonuclease family protein [Agrobacterium larrymoorei]QYA10816.1 thermonuclease family protein [Agrobacterium larrymoorei]